MASTQKSTILYLLLLSCCGPLLVGAVLTVLPDNDAVLVGSTVVLRCSTQSATARIMWHEFASSSGGMVVSDGKNIIQSHPNAGRYSIIGDALDYYLQITNVQVSDGGTYLCQDITAGPPDVFRGYAELVVLGSDPVCQDFVTVTGVVIEGNSYSSECEVPYKGNLPPVMQWEGPGNFITNGTTTPTAVWSWKRFDADRTLEGGSYNCHTNFGPVFAEPGHANNTPTYTHTYQGPTILVRWGPQNLEVTPIKDVYNIGDVLTCTADSNPPSTFVWTNMRTLVTEPAGPTFTVTEELAGFTTVMRCHTEVFIEGSLYTQNIFLNVTVPAITTPTIPPESTTTTPPLADGPCGDPTGQWRSTNPNAILCVEMDSKGNLLTLIRNGTDPFFVAGNGKTVFDDHKHIGFTGIWPTGAGVGGFTGECHSCFGDEVILLSGLSRNKAETSQCGASAGTHLTLLYVMTRSGPPCRGLELDVYNPNPKMMKKMGIKARPYIPH